MGEIVNECIEKQSINANIHSDDKWKYIYKIWFNFRILAIQIYLLQPWCWGPVYDKMGRNVMFKWKTRWWFSNTLSFCFFVCLKIIPTSYDLYSGFISTFLIPWWFLSLVSFWVSINYELFFSKGSTDTKPLRVLYKLSTTLHLHHILQVRKSLNMCSKCPLIFTATSSGRMLG